MSPVGRFELILLLLAVVIGLELLARRLRLPPAAALILGGIGLALIPGTPDMELDPDLVLVLFLPPLLLASAYFTVWRDFRANLRIILQLAVGAVAFTTLVVGVVAHLVEPALPWAACFALGAIVSPPDAVAAKAVLEHVRLPPRVTVLLEGESLVNDATGLVLFRFAVVAGLTGAFDAWQAVFSFGTVAAGGVVVGIAFGVGASYLLTWLRDPLLSVLGSALAAWGSYIGADAIGVSGVLSTVACGLVLGWRQHKILSAVTRLNARAVWDVVVFVLESLVFILIGLSLRGVLQRLGGSWAGLLPLLPAAAAIVAAVVLSRFAWIFPAVYVPRALIPSLRQRDPFPPVAVPIVMSWAGMRGVVSLAAALSLPGAFPGRDFILATTFAVILVTVLLQGTTLAPLIQMLRLGGFDLSPDGDRLSEAEARARMAAAQLAAVEQLGVAPDGTERHPRLIEQYRFRAQASLRFSDAKGALIEHRNEHFDVVLAALEAGRAEVLRLHKAGEIHDMVLSALELELDLEEVTALRHRAGGTS
ncbi:MAG: Na+/H+ antiporter [Acetobacteraceae bacterium]